MSQQEKVQSNSIPLPETEIQLPSKGLLYNSKIPNGLVTLRPYTTVEETILANGRGGSGTKLISTILSRCIVKPQIDPRELLITDRFYLMLVLRAISYNTAYNFKVECERCSTMFTHYVDPQKDLKVKELADGVTEPFKLNLPMSKSVLEVQFLRATDEEAIETYTAQKLQKRIQEGDPGYMYTMARQIASWDGETDGLTILARVERMIAGDAMALRDAIEDNECGVDTDLEVLCPKCGHINELSMPITADFFRPRRSKHDRHS